MVMAIIALPPTASKRDIQALMNALRAQGRRDSHSAAAAGAGGNIFSAHVFLTVRTGA
jgi:hypothetical protein